LKKVIHILFVVLKMLRKTYPHLLWLDGIWNIYLFKPSAASPFGEAADENFCLLEIL